MPTFEASLAAIDDRFARFREERGAPGLAWGVIRDGELVHAGGAGTAVDGEAIAPGADTVFRIASMTKSFTAATILALRDEGRLRLDEPVAAYVPDLAGWRHPAADAPEITVRHLLTMAAGLPTDDPWGDRQQSLPLDAFAALLRSGPTFAWPPGTSFEYSNLGYGILGRVITNVAGTEYHEVVEGRLLAPLGMSSTAYREEDVAPERLAHGYVRQGNALVREGRDVYGAMASMGGLYSTVGDLARWVAFFTDAYPARSDAEDLAGASPLRRSTRREMQQVHRAFNVEIEGHAPDAAPTASAGGYGFGLFVTQDSDLGTFVGHSGGYPSYGSNMTWHPATGLGIVALANLRYAGPSMLVGELLSGLVREGAAPRRRVRPSPATERARAIAEGLVARWDDAVADAEFAMNMDLDEPRSARREAVEAAVRDLGPLRPDPERPVVSWSAAHLRWWMRGERGWLRLEVLVTPEPEPRIQSLRVHRVVAPSPALVEAGERLLGAAADAEARGLVFGWPAGLACAPSVDGVAVARAFTAGTARFGRMRLGAPVDGDGTTSSTWGLVTERGGAATLKVALEPDSGAVTAVALRAAPREPPDDAW